MNNSLLREELAYGLVLSKDHTRLETINYDIIPENKIYAVKLKTGSYTILQKTDKFDDEVLKPTETLESTLSFLKENISGLDQL